MHTELADMLTEAATLMLIGMSIVFIFLSFLIGAVNFTAWICAKSPEGQDQTVTRQSSQKSPVSSSTRNIPPSTVAVISAAIHQHRNAS